MHRNAQVTMSFSLGGAAYLRATALISRIWLRRHREWEDLRVLKSMFAKASQPQPYGFGTKPGGYSIESNAEFKQDASV
jgi:hypothetical protein